MSSFVPLREQPEAYPDDGSTTVSDDGTESMLIAQLLCRVRLASLRKCDSSVISYDPSSYLVVFSLQGRNTRQFLAPFLLTSLWSVLVAAVLGVPEDIRGTDAEAGS